MGPAVARIKTTLGLVTQDIAALFSCCPGKGNILLLVHGGWDEK